MMQDIVSQEIYEVLDSATQHLQEQYGDDLISVIGFGSRFNGYYHEKSDYDLFAVIDNDSDKFQGLYKFDIGQADTHAIVVTQNEFEKSIMDYENLPMEHNATTVFNYEVSLGQEYVHNLNQENKYNVISDIMDNIAFLSHTVEKDDTVLFSRNNVIESSIAKTLLSLPQICERYERMKKADCFEEVLTKVSDSYQIAFDSLEEEGIIHKVESGDNPVYEFKGQQQNNWLRSPMMKNIYSSLAKPVKSLVSLASKHKHITSDSKALINGLIYGPVYVGECLIESTYNAYFSIKREETLELNDDGNYEYNGLTIDEVLDAPDFILSLRKHRNSIKDFIV